jgi:hypothetical protein
MSKPDIVNGQVVSLRSAFGMGLGVACHHRVFVLVAIFALVWERSVAIYTSWRGIGVLEFATQYKEMVVVTAKHPLDGFANVRPYGELYAFMTVVVVLLVAGAFLWVGILGLLRDLLVRRGYDVRKLGRRGGEYFWRILRFKAPIYTLLGVILAMLGSFALLASNAGFRALAAVGTGVLLFGLFLFARVLLSLGPKMIVTCELSRMLLAYRQVWQLARPHLVKVLVFQVMLLCLGSVPLFLPVGLAAVGAGGGVSVLLTLVVGAFIAVVGKASSFCLYLQLAGSQVPQSTPTSPCVELVS